VQRGAEERRHGIGIASRTGDPAEAPSSSACVSRYAIDEGGDGGCGK